MNLKDLIHYIQRAKVGNSNLVYNHVTKITPEIQATIPVGSPDILPLASPDDALALMSSGGIIPGAYYSIDNVNPYLYGGTKIIVYGVDVNNFSKQGWGLFYNPPYNNMDMFFADNEYSIGDQAIYGGKIWTNLHGNASTSVDILNLNTDEWAPVAYNPTDYNAVWDFIEYDIQWDYIVTRVDVQNNNTVSVNFLTNIWYWCEVSPIQVFRWGHPYIPWDSDTGVTNCHIIDSYCNCLNFVDGYIQGLTMSNFSSISGLEMYNGSYIDNISVTNYSSISDLYLDNGYIENLYLNNDSGMDSITIVDSNLSDIRIDSDSWISSIGLFDSSRITDTNLAIDSGIYDLALGSSSIGQVNLENDAWIGGIEMTNSSFWQFDFNKGGMDNMNITDSEFWNITINNGQFNDLTCDSGYNFFNVDIIGHEISFDVVEDISGGTQNASEYKYNTIKIQFGFSLNSIAQNATITMPPIYIPTGFFIHSALIDAINLVGATDATAITLGIDTDAPTNILDGTTGLFSTINNTVSLIRPTPVKAGTYRKITGQILGADSVSGDIAIELILKNVNYSFDND